jgi:hypothetical protein
MTAAMVRQTAAPAAKVNSEIHMARFSLFLLWRRLDRCSEQGDNAVPAGPFLELAVFFRVKSHLAG